MNDPVPTDHDAPTSTYTPPTYVAPPAPPSYNADPNPWTPPPVGRPARSIAGLVLLVVVFIVGVAVGSTGVLGRSGSSTSASGGTPPIAAQPGASAVPGASAPPNAPADFSLFWEAL